MCIFVLRIFLFLKFEASLSTLIMTRTERSEGGFWLKPSSVCWVGLSGEWKLSGSF